MEISPRAVQAPSPEASVIQANTLAGALLECISPAMREVRDRRFKRLVDLFGFQPSSARNQFRHYESLLLSHMSTTSVD
eukprot:4981270-Prymnesium_polylepis.1